MSFYATTTIAILRGTEVDEYGDELDTDTAVATGIRASISEREMRDIDRASGDLRTLRVLTGRVNTNVDIRDGDRIRDERTGTVYAVSAISRPVSFTGVSSTRLDLDIAT